jgi:hypothetical protein
LAVNKGVLVAAALVAVGAAGFGYLERASKQPPPPSPPLTDEAKTYVRERHLILTDVNMSAHEDYFKQRIVEITGQIQNAGLRPLRLVEINCVFYDPYGQVVLRQRTPIVSPKAGGLSPGITKSFRLPFDNIPESWNNVMPQMVIARIDFQ